MSPCLCVLCAKFFALLVLVWVRARNSSPSTLKTPQFRRFCACWASFSRRRRWRGRVGRVFRGSAAGGAVLGEFFRETRRCAKVLLAVRHCPCRWRWGFCTTRSLQAARSRRVGASCRAIPPDRRHPNIVSVGMVPKVQTTSAKNAENGVLWVRWSAFWAQRCLSWCVVRTRTPEPAR